MRINKIILKNYRQYNDNSIEFHKNSEYDLHFIIGSNGTGKTTLLNAITWCLYGEEPHLGLKSKSLPIVNIENLKELETGKTCFVKVEIHIEIDDGNVIFSREHLYRKTEENQIFKLSETFNVIITLNGKDSEIYENEIAEDWVNKLLPKRIREFFFFDGEQLDEYFVTDKGSKIETSIFEISQVELLNRMNDRLCKISDEFRKDASKLNPKTEKINKDYEKEILSKENAIKDIDICTEQIIISKKRLKECNDFLRGQQDIAELETKREELNESLEEERKKLSFKKISLKNFIVEYTTLLNILPNINKTLEIINKKENSGELPPKIDRQFLKSMITSGKCFICNNGRPF